MLRQIHPWKRTGRFGKSTRPVLNGYWLIPVIVRRHLACIALRCLSLFHSVSVRLSQTLTLACEVRGRFNLG